MGGGGGLVGSTSEVSGDVIRCLRNDAKSLLPSYMGERRGVVVLLFTSGR